MELLIKKLFDNIGGIELTEKIMSDDEAFDHLSKLTIKVPFHTVANLKMENLGNLKTIR